MGNTLRKISKVNQRLQFFCRSFKKIGVEAYTGGNYRTLKQRLEKEKIDVTHIFERQKSTKEQNKSNNKEIPLSEILVVDSTYMDRSKLKKKLISQGLLIEKCSKCRIGTEWNGLPLTLQLEHKNGVNNDHRLENLELICPNCHSQTETYAGRNTRKDKKKEKNDKIYNCTNCLSPISRFSKTGLCRKCANKAVAQINKTSNRKVVRPDSDTLISLIVQYGFSKTGDKFGVSDNSVRKWCKDFNIPHKVEDLKKYAKNHNIS